ncbi:bifunctional [glutamine synthetase] adenylyltransferase/[glutamine synthetase]-adenylyl-L-tyrosine phosphorylase [Zavarzinia sp. CC-PAN008]|uniref:bifunctional [glutamine synthetase] adenylyltransferase/[glutamine synthetase]-adenylyl-L-tyrosine phosphorylase n=1 Tax=Zavarzinia sp. CC-PAN008 TaxID=3243332 RepID=UPI003F74406D
MPLAPPAAFDAAAAARGHVDFAEALARVGSAANPADSAMGRALLDGAFGCSPYLTQLCRLEPLIPGAVLERGADAVVAEAIALAASGAAAGSEADLMRTLRLAKRRMALAVGLADIGGLWTMDQVVRALSHLAETAIGAAVDWLLAERVRRGDLAEARGYFVLGMGKLGAGELNYSSDIDLIVLFDPQVMRWTGRTEQQEGLVRMTRTLVKVLQDRTGDGYVFRTDLRLRPDPSATPIAMSADAAELYYQSMGRNWERAAMIKARPVAGDIEAGRGFLERIGPFVWRRHLDFVAVRDIRSMKQLIHQHHGLQRPTVRGGDVKLGPGGIRDIEFLVQTQQLVSGGRNPAFREPTTLGMLATLGRSGLLTPDVAERLAACYRLLRTVEHRLQMIADEQTHAVPDEAEAEARVACFLGYPDTAAFEAALLAALTFVDGQISVLFPDMDDGPAAAATPEADQLLALGFKEPARVLERLGAWRAGRHRSLQTERARMILERLTPRLVQALARSADPDAALVRFDSLLAGLPAGVSLLSLLEANPWLLALLVEVMGSAPALAEQLGRRPALLDGLIGQEFGERPPARPALEAELAARLASARGAVDIALDLARVWLNERRFQVGVQLLHGVISTEVAGAALADLAETVIGGLFPLVEANFAIAHGRVPDGGLACLALGRLGSRAMTMTSDLDLIFIYSAGEDPSDGVKPLPPPLYYARLTQRLVTSLSAPTGEGRLYEVDMQLRPSGSKGPLAVSLGAFERYQMEEAWTWEHLALVRARPVYGPPALQDAIAAVVHGALARPRAAEATLAEVAAMRRRIAKEFKPHSRYDLKYTPGGLFDFEFIAQGLVLAHAQAHPELICADMAVILERAGAAGLLEAGEAADLAAATRFQRGLLALLRLTSGEGFRPDTAPAPLKQALARGLALPDFSTLDATLAEHQARVADVYERRIAVHAPPAEPQS